MENNQQRIFLKITQKDLEIIQEQEQLILSINKNLLSKLQEISEQEEILLELQKTIIVKKVQIPNIIPIQKEINKISTILETTEKYISSITNKDLNEIAKYVTPPDKIKLTMEAIFLLLKGQILHWDKIQIELSNGNFINQVLELDAEKVDQKVINRIQKQYLDSKQWNTEKIKTASKAISPFVDWLIYELLYIQLQKKILPKQKIIQKKQVEIQLLLEKEQYLIEKINQLKEQRKDLIQQIHQQKIIIHNLYSRALDQMKIKSNKINFSQQFSNDLKSFNGTLDIQFFDTYYNQHKQQKTEINQYDTKPNFELDNQESKFQQIEKPSSSKFIESIIQKNHKYQNHFINKQYLKQSLEPHQLFKQSMQLGYGVNYQNPLKMTFSQIRSKSLNLNNKQFSIKI